MALARGRLLGRGRRPRRRRGLLSGAAFANGDRLTLTYDPLTRRRTGATHATARYTASTTHRLGVRGLVDAETMTVGSTSLSRAYGYSAQRFLTSSSDAQARYAYGFDASGLPTSIAKNGATRTLTESATALTTGTVTYGFDGLHRTVSRADSAAPAQSLALTCGADGQLATARKGGTTFGFIHDEAGQRLLKLAGGTPVAAYVEEGYLDATGLTERFQVGGRTVGLLKSGVFTAVPTDLHGTVMAEPAGAARIASPFGQRDVHPTTAAALDYVEKGFDADLGLVRMGVRDYDPEINRFTTADPLLLEHPESCQVSPVECNLYSYAGNRPVGRTDSTGQWAIVDDLIASGVGAAIGVAAQGIGDLASGKLSSWQDYTAAAVGGAVMGEVTLHAGPLAGAAAGSAATNGIRQGLNMWTGKQESFRGASPSRPASAPGWASSEPSLLRSSRSPSPTPSRARSASGRRTRTTS